MGRNCSICALSEAGLIAQRLAEGRSARAVSLEFAVPYDSLRRHRRHHIFKPEAVPAPGPKSADDPLDELIRSLRLRALGGSDQAAREYRLALAAQSDVRHAAPPRRDLETEPEWIALRTKMLAALEPFPEARLAIAAAIREPE